MLKRLQPHQDEKCLLKATHWSSVNDEETVIPQGRLQLAPNITHSYSRRVAHIYSSNINVNLGENETIYTEARNS